MVQSADILIDDVKKLRAVVAKKAKKYKLTPMIGRTHGVHAEPITFGLKMALMYDEFGRALERLERARDIVAVGKISGAVGTYAHMIPKVEAIRLPEARSASPTGFPRRSSSATGTRNS